MITTIVDLDNIFYLGRKFGTRLKMTVEYHFCLSVDSEKGLMGTGIGNFSDEVREFHKELP